MFKKLKDQTAEYRDDWMIAQVNMIKFVTAEAVLTFCISLPLLIMTTIAFVENVFRVDF